MSTTTISTTVTQADAIRQGRAIVEALEQGCRHASSWASNYEDEACPWCEGEEGYHGGGGPRHGYTTERSWLVAMDEHSAGVAISVLGRQLCDYAKAFEREDNYLRRNTQGAAEAILKAVKQLGGTLPSHLEQPCSWSSKGRAHTEEWQRRWGKG